LAAESADPASRSVEGGEGERAPERAGLVLATLIIVAAVANLPLAMANVALPTIAEAFDASQAQLLAQYHAEDTVQAGASNT
jgi:hypothetical protein